MRLKKYLENHADAEIIHNLPRDILKTIKTEAGS